MAKYRKKPLIIEAFRMGIDPRPDWFQDKVSEGKITTHIIKGGGPFMQKKTYCIIQTLEGNMKGDYGDYIIRGIKGECYPCKPEVFEATYDSVEEC